MTDQEFRPHAEAWLAAHQRELHLTKLITAGSSRMAELKMPKAVATLDTLGDELAEVRRLEQGQSMLRQLQRGEREIMDREATIIRGVLPQDVWYQVNGHGVRHYHSVQIQVRDWEEVQEELHAQAA
jgi:hypothetical protein